MPRGLKETSSLIAIGFSVTESGPNTFTEATIDLQLNPLDNEVFVVYAIDLDCDAPDATAGLNTTVNGSLSTTSRTTVGTLANSHVMASKKLEFRGGGLVDSGVAFETGSNENPATQLDYLGIISTTDFMIQINSANQVSAKTMNGRVYGARAKADASVYAALVQSELLSA